MTHTIADDGLIDQLAELFLAEHRRGEHPNVEEYALRHPGLAARIRELFPALLDLEQLGSAVAALPLSTGAAPARLGEYRIVREIGRGGMGVVYEAIQETLGRHVALKVLSVGPRSEGVYLERFRREAKIAAQLHHSNIVPVYGVGADGGSLYYAMQFIHGQGLDAVLAEVRRQRAGETPPGAAATTESSAGSLALATEPIQHYYRSVARLALQGADALAYAHSQNVIHRDIKPSNLLLDAHANLWIADFGLAKSADTDDLTGAGDLIGTLRYMAPERFAGLADAGADVFSLGATLFEMLALRPAFDAAHRAQLVEQVTHGVLPRLGQLDPSIPRDLETIVLKAMAHEAAERYTAAAMADDLRNYLADRPVTARRISPVERARRWAHRNPAVAALTAAVAVALLAGAVVSAALAIRAKASAESADEARVEMERERDRAVAARQSARDTLSAMTAQLIEENSILTREPQISREQKQFLENLLPRFHELADQAADAPAEREQIGRIACQLGVIYYRLGRYADGLGPIQQSVRIRKQLAVDTPDNADARFRLAHSCQWSATLLSKLSRFSESIDEGQRAIELLKSLKSAAQLSGTARTNLAESYVRLASDSFRLARRAEADAACRAGIAECDSLIGDEPASPLHALNRARLWAIQSDLEDVRGHRDRADNLIRSALKEFDRRVVAGPRNFAIRAELAHLQFARAGTLVERDQAVEAEAFASLAVEHLEKLTAEFPGVVAYRSELAAVRNALGASLRMRGRWAESERAYLAAIECHDAIVREFPDVPLFAIRRFAVFANMGLVVRESKNAGDSLPWFGQAIDGLQPIVAASPNDVLARQYLRNSLWNRAGALMKLERYSEALSDIDRAIALETGELPPQGQWQAMTCMLHAGQLDRALTHAEKLAVRRDASADWLFDCARVFAAASERGSSSDDYASRSVSLLRKSMMRGLPLTHRIWSDGFLAPLRGRDDFWAFVWEWSN